MSQSSNKSSLQSKVKPQHHLRSFKHPRPSDNKQTNKNSEYEHLRNVDFEEYLLTEHDLLSGQSSESLGYNQDNPFSQTDNENLTSNLTSNQSILEIAQNYTFAIGIPSHRKQPAKYFNFNQIPSIIKNSINFSQISHQPMLNSPELNFNPSDLAQNSIQSSYSSAHKQTDRQNSLSDSQQDQGVTIYKSKQIEEEMFLKISQQTKEILILQQKLYYFQDFCKRLLKSNEEKENINKKVANQFKMLKKKSKDQNQTMNQLQLKLQSKEKQILQLKFSSPKPKTPRNDCFSIKIQAQKKNLAQKQNIQQLYHLQKEKKMIDDKYRILLGTYEKVQTKFTAIDSQVVKLRKSNEILKKKNENLQNVNRILEKEISELNIKIFQFQKEMQDITCKNYASNLNRIKTLAQTGVDLFSSKNPQKNGMKDFLDYGSLRRI